MTKNNESDRMEIDYSEQISRAFPEIKSIEDPGLREKTERAWKLALRRGGWRDIEDIPHTWNITELNTIDHLRGVYKVAMASAEIQEEFYGTAEEEDILRVLALTHDVGKCFEYTVHVDDDLLVDPDPTYVGDDIPHQLSGYALAYEVGMPPKVRHGIPHGKYEIPERTIEAELITSANSVSTNAMTMKSMGITIDEWVEEYHP